MWSLRVFDNYLKGAGYGSGGANGFTLGAPAALYGLDNVDNIINQHQCITGANPDTHPASAALFRLYQRHFQQLVPTSVFKNYFTAISGLCL